GGERDHSKRPKMGSVATKFADVVYVTSDNPRHEDAQEIIDQILSGVGESGTVQVEVDRRRAIGAAFSNAKPGDIVVIAGKGHEATQTIGDEELKFSDADVSRELLRFAS
ncbi:MAG: glutamate ligase domain-containing protein, partial [Actinomycetota bacterium]